MCRGVLQVTLRPLTLNVPAALPPGHSAPVDAECVLQASLRPLTLNVPAALPPTQSAPVDVECARGASSRPVDAEWRRAGNGRNSRRIHHGPARRSFISDPPHEVLHMSSRISVVNLFMGLRGTTKFEGEVGDVQRFRRDIRGICRGIRSTCDGCRCGRMIQSRRRAGPQDR